MTMQDIEQLGGELLAAVAAAGDAETLEAARVAALGRKGALTAALKDLQSLDAEARKARAQTLNQIKDRVTAAIAARKAVLEAGALDARLKAERLDVTLPARPAPEGRIHPVSQVMDELVEIFAAMDFRVAEGPDIEDDFHNFTALNMPPDHPARQDFDTFYLRGRPPPPPGGGSPDGAGERKLLRTHTSPVQIRAMRASPPPHRIIVPGRTYRRDSDQTHTPMFHQIEGLVIDRAVHMGHLKGVLHDFCAAFFEVKNLRMRFRPSYFPFTEPSAEVDIGCTRKGGEIRVGAGDDWLEILGCGMVNRRVLEHCGVDADEWQGFAWGLGIDRMAMLKYGIPDLRTFFDGDLAWLRHYGFVPLDVPALGQGLSR
jgi:phenylalanyl-tRNA synthetase alpha chain